MPDVAASSNCNNNDDDATILTRKHWPLITFSVGGIAGVCFILGYVVGPCLTTNDPRGTFGLSSGGGSRGTFVRRLNTATTTSSLSSSSSSSAAAGLLTTPSIYYYNNYTLVKPLAGLYPWENIVEPYRKTTFLVQNPVSNYTYHWFIDGWHKEDGVVTEVAFGAPTGVTQLVTVQMRNAVTGQLHTSTDLAVIGKYVRRELRQLADQDRVAFFQAISTMQRIPTQVGKKIYGPKYRSKDFFNRIHLYYGGSKSCDHWHQGPGFVTSHVAFSLMYEQSLQSVNPSISLPYWDFTLESTFFTPNTFRQSGVFSAGWFGDPICNNSLHTPTEGRFAYVPVMQNSQNFSKIVSPYGLLKSPWNADPSSYLSRSDRIFGLKNNLKVRGKEGWGAVLCCYCCCCCCCGCGCDCGCCCCCSCGVPCCAVRCCAVHCSALPCFASL